MPPPTSGTSQSPPCPPSASRATSLPAHNHSKPHLSTALSPDNGSHPSAGDQQPSTSNPTSLADPVLPAPVLQYASDHHYFHHPLATHDGPYHQPLHPAQPTSNHANNLHMFGLTHDDTTPEIHHATSNGTSSHAQLMAGNDYMDVVSMLNNHDVDMDSASEDEGDLDTHHYMHFHEGFWGHVHESLWGHDSDTPHYWPPPASPPSLPSFNTVFGQFIQSNYSEDLAIVQSSLSYVDDLYYTSLEDAMNPWVLQPPDGTDSTLFSPSPLATSGGHGQGQGMHTVASPNPNLLAPINPGLEKFIKRWGWQGKSLRGLPRGMRVPRVERLRLQLENPRTTIEYDELEGDTCDMQGIDWEHIEVTRNEARERRLTTYNNFTSTQGSDQWHPHFPDVQLPRSDSFFRFKRMYIRKNTHLAHFQLRHLVACASRTQVFYTGRNAVHQFNPITGASEVALKAPDLDSVDIPISTIDAGHGVLVSGNFHGEYVVRKLEYEHEDDEYARISGILTSSTSAITNHVQIQVPRRSSSPQACFASNDVGFRVLDIATNKIVQETMFDFPINCTAVSPDRQLRVMVGDNKDVLVMPADGGRIEIVGSTARGMPLQVHRDHGFACAWADDGYTVATGFQDRLVTVWDARNWSRPLASIRTEMAGCRSLRFSPVGSGHRVLVAAEEADFVNIIDARTLRSKQTIDVFGEIGGTAFDPDGGRDLFVFVPDSARGGILQLDRVGDTGSLTEEVQQYEAPRGSHRQPEQQQPWSKRYASSDEDDDCGDEDWPHALRWRSAWGRTAKVQNPGGYDWPQVNMAGGERRSRGVQARRRRMEAVLDEMEFF